jgi:hypothetical protein
MKVLCPVCNVEGILEQRGNSQRVLHYKGFINGKRMYEKHNLTPNNGNKSLGVKSVVLGSYRGTMAGGEGFEPSTPNLGGWCSLRGNIKTKRDPPLCREFSYPC